MVQKRRSQSIAKKLSLRYAPHTKVLKRVNFFSGRELAELPKVLISGEQVLAVLSGMYTAGTAILCVTSHRLILIDKKLIRLSLEDIRFESIREIHYSRQPLTASIRLYYAGREMQFRTWHKKELRVLSQLVQQKMFEVSERKTGGASTVGQKKTEHKYLKSNPSELHNNNALGQVDKLTAQLQPISNGAEVFQTKNDQTAGEHQEHYITQQLTRLKMANSFVDRLRMTTKAGRHVLELETRVPGLTFEH